VLNGGFPLAQYPCLHLAVVSDRGSQHDELAEVLAAADLLAPAGFHLVQVIHLKPGPVTAAVLARRPPNA
jgi:hypothetical protein